MPKQRPLLLTIHGVGTRREWQEEVAKETFEPLFECVTLRYDAYHRFGKLKLASYILALVFIATMIGLAYLRGAQMSMWYWLSLATLLGA